MADKSHTADDLGLVESPIRQTPDEVKRYWDEADMSNVKPVPMPKVVAPNDYSGYGWIKVKKYKDDPMMSWEDRFYALSNHHVEETQFLIEKVRELAAKLNAK